MSHTPKTWFFLTLAALLLAATPLARAAEPLLSLGKPDRSTAEFALAPGKYRNFKEDALFVAGRSDPRRDWPYVHPGPIDAWAGSRSHTFTLFFALKKLPAEGDCTLTLDLADTHYASPPTLQVRINGTSFTPAPLPLGTGDQAIGGQPEKGRPHRCRIAFPAKLLAGRNQVDITTTAGSWMLYDALSLETPAGAVLDDAPAAFVQADPPSSPVLSKKDGKSFQAVSARIFYAGEPCDAAVRLNGADVGTIRLEPGRQTRDLLLPAVDKPTTMPLELLVGQTSLLSTPITLHPVRRWTVYLLPHSHNDIGYTQLQPEVEKKQWNNFEIALDAANKTAGYPAGARFKWNSEILWSVDGYLRQATPQKRQAFLDAVKSGQIHLDGLYANELTALCRPEELLRLTSLAHNLARETGVPIESAMISDVPGYTWGLVTAMGESGIKYFSIGPNESDRIGYTLRAWGDKPFYWQSPDSRHKVLCWVAAHGYSWFLGKTLAQRGPAVIFSYLEELERNKFPYDIVQLRYATHGDNGAPDPTVADFVRQWNETHDSPRLVIATTTEMFREFEKRYADQLPVVRGDFTPYWEDGAPSSAREIALNRQAAERLSQAETLFALTGAPVPDFSSAWRNILLFDEHTWGAHNSVSEPDAPFVRDQWKIKQAFALDGAAAADKILADALAPGADAPPGSLRVWNTCNFRRGGLVLLPPELSRPGDRILDDSGAAVPAQRLSTGELAFRADDLPGLSARVFKVVAGASAAPGPDAARAEATRLSNALLSLEVDPKTGAIANFKTAAGVELVDPQAGHGLNEYLYLPGSDVRRVQRVENVTVRIKEKGPLVASLLIESQAPGCNRLTRELRLVAGLPRLEIFNTVDKKAVRAKEGVHFAFPLNVPNGTMRMEIPFAVIRPELDQLPGACKNWFTVQRFVDVSNDTLGITCAVVDAPLVEVGALTANLPAGQPNPDAYLKTLAPSSTFYSWVMNNHWHTNYRAEQEGPVTFRYVLTPHGPYDPLPAARAGMEASRPLLAAPGNTPVPGPAIEGDGIILAGFKPADEGKACILHLLNTTDAPQSVKIAWPGRAPPALSQSDAAERPGPKIEGPVTLPPRGFIILRAQWP